jgi:transcription elongation factor GreA
MEKVPMTAEGYHALDEELKRLKTVERPAVIAAIGEARLHGDLSENAEYHAAKDDQAHLETRILKLRQRLRNAQVVEVATGSDVVRFGSTVTFVDEGTGKEQTFTIVGTTEQDLKAGKLSSESPIAQALSGAKAGDVVAVETPGGKRDMRVTQID